MNAGRTLLRYVVPGAFFFLVTTVAYSLYAVTELTTDITVALINAAGLLQTVVLLAGASIPLGMFFDALDGSVHVGNYVSLTTGDIDPGAVILAGVPPEVVRDVAGETPRPIAPQRAPFWTTDTGKAGDPFLDARRYRRWASLIIWSLGHNVDPQRRYFREQIEINRQIADTVWLHAVSTRNIPAEASQCQEMTDRGRMYGASRVAVIAAFLACVGILASAFVLNIKSGESGGSVSQRAEGVVAAIGLGLVIYVVLRATRADRGLRAAGAPPDGESYRSEADRACRWTVALAICGGLLLLSGATATVLPEGQLQAIVSAVGRTALPATFLLATYRIMNTARRQARSGRLRLQARVLARELIGYAGDTTHASR